MRYEIFISHSSKEKEDIVLPLRDILMSAGVAVWIDKDNISLCEKSINKIDTAIAANNRAVVVLSPYYFDSQYAMVELETILSLGIPVIVILHNITYEEVQQKSSITAPFYSINSEIGIDNIAVNIISEINASIPTFEDDDSTVIGISGASCSGKTWLANKLNKECSIPVTMFYLDSFYRTSEEIFALDHKFDNPRSIDYVEAAGSLAQLLSGKPTKVPIYNFEKNRREGTKVLTLAPLIIIEGIFAFSVPAIIRHMDLKIWVQSTDDILYERRVQRDVEERGRNYQSVIDQYRRDVKPGYQRFVHPFIHEADVILQNNGHKIDYKPKIIDMLLSYVYSKKATSTI